MSQKIRALFVLLLGGIILIAPFSSILAEDPPTIVVRFRYPELAAVCSVSPNPASVNTQVIFSVGVSGGTGAYTYVWSGACEGTQQVCAKSFAAAGEHTANVVVTSGSQTKSLACPVTVEQANDPVSALFSVSNSQPYVDDTVILTITGKDNDGVANVCLDEEVGGGQPDISHGCAGSTTCPDGSTECTKAWSIKKTTAGQYIFKARVNGKTPAGATESASVNPITVEFKDMPNDVVSGTISASKTDALVNENITFTITGQDDEGVNRVCLQSTGGIDHGCQTCSDITSCQKTWNITKATAGDYAFYGIIFGKKSDNTEEQAYAQVQ